MTTSYRALAFGILTALTLTFTLEAMSASAPIEVIRLEAVHINAQRANFDADGNVIGTGLQQVVVTGRADAR